MAYGHTTNWKHILTHLAVDAERRMDELRYRMHYQLGGVGPIKIITYRGYGTPERLYLHGRVLEDKNIPAANKNDKLWENLVNMYKRAESDEVPHARLVARFQGSQQEIEADEEGFFDVMLTPTRPLADHRLWHGVELELISPIPAVQERDPIKATGQVLVPPPTARCVVVSDIDDTIVRTDATHLLRMAQHVFLGNAHTRLPFPGVAALYRALFTGKTGAEMNPLFYVSSSPWNLYDLLAQFFNLHGIPVGPVLFLRDWGLTEEEILPLHHRKYKTAVIRQMLRFYPHLPFILIGDSGQEDPEIYADLVDEFPRRIQTVYIRNVSRDLKRPDAIQTLAQRVLKAGSTLVLANDSLAIAEHAVQAGYISAEALPDIREDKHKDEEPPNTIEVLLGEEPAPAQPPAPTIKVTGQTVKQGSLEKTIKEAGSEKSAAPPNVVVESKHKQNK